MDRDLVLAIDNGTQSVRALIFDAAGTLVAKSRVPLDEYRSPHPGWHEHDVRAFWRALCQACKGLWQEDDSLQTRIAAVAVTTQRATMINVDADGEPLRAAITWLDQRKTAAVPHINKRWRAAFALARVSSTIQYFQSEAEANWIRAHEPHIWERTHKFLLLSGYLNFRLTGSFADSAASQVGYIPFDYKHLRWAADSDWKWQAVAVDRSMLPDLVSPSQRLGEVSAEAAYDTGLRKGTPVIAAATDKACEVLGAGCIDPHVGAISYGTTATFNVCSQRYVEPTAFIPPYPAALPGAYNVEVQIFRGYWMVRWFMEQFAIGDESELDELVSDVPPGSLGLVVQPYWSPGLKTPGPHAKGAMIGFGDVHGKAHIYRALLEGLAYALREGRERIERRGKFHVDVLRVAGGGSQSDAAMQLTADIFGLPAQRPHVYEISGLGAAIDAAVGIGLHRDFGSAVTAMTGVARTFEPDPRTHQMYGELYDRVYRRMYARLAPLYEAIADITGYPAPRDAFE